MAEYASKGVAGSGLGLGIAGTALGLLNGNGLGNLFGMGCNAAYACSDNMPINRYEATKSARIAELETEVKLRDANTYTLGEVGKLRDYMERRLDRVEHEICDQKVYNATNIATVNCIANQVNQLYSLTKLVVPNTSICPGWGDVTVSVTPAATA